MAKLANTSWTFTACGVLAATGFPLIVSNEKFANPGTASPARETRALPQNDCANALQTSGYRWREFRFLVKERQDFFHQRVGCDAVFLP
jgi:hypothetical protein